MRRTDFSAPSTPTSTDRSASPSGASGDPSASPLTSSVDERAPFLASVDPTAPRTTTAARPSWARRLTAVDPSHADQLAALGWDESWQNVLPSALAGLAERTRLRSDLVDAPAAAGLVPHVVPARVTRVDRAVAVLLTEQGEVRARLRQHLLTAAAEDLEHAVCTGDWVLASPDPSLASIDGETAWWVEQLLPRRSAIVRAAVSPGTSHRQVLAANVDLAIIVEPLQPEPDLGRIERLLALVWDSGAQPVVVLSKADLATDAADQRLDVSRAAPGVEVIVMSAVDGAGVDQLRSLLDGARTGVLLGPSGAGKSTLTNTLLGEEHMSTRALRADLKGRHTTVHRELVPLAGGGLLIDTPGLRRVDLPGADGGLDAVFADIEALAAKCRFLDCGHSVEPGCAVLEAVEGGELSERRLRSWHKLQREAAYMAGRHDARVRAEQRTKWKRIHTEMRRSGRARP